MHPNPLVVRLYAQRGMRLWASTRALASLLIVLAEGHPLRTSPTVIVQLVLLSVAVCFVDTWRLRERALLGNLGVSPAVLAGLFGLAAMTGEGLLLLAGSLLA